MTQAVQSMTNRTLSGLFWMSLATGANVFSLLLVVVVLARLLTPADFGLAAAALMVIGFTAIFAELGIGPALVQRQDLQPTHIRSGFTLALSLALACAAGLWFAAPIVATLFGLEELTPIVQLLALVFPVQSLGLVAESLLQRELRFRCLAVLDTVSVLIGFGGVGITLGFLGFGAWALVGAHLAQISLRTVLLLIFRPHSASPVLDRRACADLLGFGGGFTAGRFSNYLAGQGENFIIGGWLGPVALGVYGRAYQLMAGPAVLLGNVLDRVLFPAMAQMQNQPKRLADAYRRGNALIALVILPVSVLVVALAPEVIQVVLGAEWGAVTLPLQILAVGMLFRTSCKISDSLVRATGAVHRRTWRQTAYAILVVAGAWVGQHWGIEGVAVAVLATLVINFLLMAHLSLCLADMSWRTFLGAHFPGFALAALLGLPAFMTAQLCRTWNFQALVILGLSAAAMLPFLGAAVFLPGLFLGRDGQWMVRKLFALIFPVARGARLYENHPNAGELNAPRAQDHPLARLTRNLASEHVRYCRWKSRVDLPRLLSGEGDLDLLVHPGDADTLLRVAEQLGFKRVESCFDHRQLRELHLYGLDDTTGVLLHLHVNLWLLGDRHSGLEELVLQNCAPEESPGLLSGMPVVQPAAELIAFVLCAMEQSARLSAAPRLIAKRDIRQTKLQALVTGDAEENWRGLLARWLPTVPAAQFAECVAVLGQPASWLREYMLARKLQVFTSLAHAGGSLLHRLVPKLSLGTMAWRLWDGRGNPKQLPTGGVVVAIIGPDASGKSTMVAETTRWLGQVFRVQTAHLGKPPSTWLTWLPNLAGRLLGRVAPRLRTFHQTPALPAASGRGEAGGQGLLYRLRAVLLAWDRRALALRIARRAAQGWIVVCDRYPTDVVGAPDSARLKSPEDEAALPWLHVWLARLENRLYREIPRPDVVLRLSAPLGVAIDRNRDRHKPGKESDDFVERRHKDFFVPKFTDTPIIELDTSASQTESVHMLRRLVWEWLCRPAPRESGGQSRESRVERPEFSVQCSESTGMLGSGLSTLDSRPRRKALNSQDAKNPLVVEFIGVTGVGKSTLIAAVSQFLSARGLRVCDAEEAILACHGVALGNHPKIRSALTFLLGLPTFGRFCLTKEGRQLSRLALGAIGRGKGSTWTGASLLRNFMKRIGAHLLLETLRDQMRDCDVVIWDEGVVHAAHNLFVDVGTNPRHDEIELFGRIVPKPDLLIWVTAPTSQSVEVVLQRGHSRVCTSQGPSAAQAFADHAQTTFEVLSRVPGLQEKIFRVDNSAEPGRNGAAISARASVLGAYLVEQIRSRRIPSPLVNCQWSMVQGPESRVESPEFSVQSRQGSLALDSGLSTLDHSPLTARTA